MKTWQDYESLVFSLSVLHWGFQWLKYFLASSIRIIDKKMIQYCVQFAGIAWSPR